MLSKIGKVNKNRQSPTHPQSLHTNTYASSYETFFFSYLRLFFPPGGFTFLLALTPYHSICGGKWQVT